MLRKGVRYMSAKHKWICVLLFGLQGCAVSGNVDVEVKVPLCPLILNGWFDKPGINVSSHIYFSHGQP